jgi:SDR family mycofactocin-dependent oxidoreductase
MGEFDGKVVFITGAARGQGRSHAVALARGGAKVAIVDRCADIESIPYPLATEDDLAETARLVTEAGGPVFSGVVDVRDAAALRAMVDDAVAALGNLDIVIANAGVVAAGKVDPFDEDVYRAIVETNLFGVWNTITATVGSIRAKKSGGSIILISSTQGLTGRGGDGSAAAFGYASAKHGVVGLMRSAAYAYAQDGIRVNTVHPTGVSTPMVLNEHMGQYFTENPNAATLAANLLPVPFVEPEDVTEAVLYLASDRARYLTGVTLPVDAGYTSM